MLTLNSRRALWTVIQHCGPDHLGVWLNGLITLSAGVPHLGAGESWPWEKDKHTPTNLLW